MLQICGELSALKMISVITVYESNQLSAFGTAVT